MRSLLQWFKQFGEALWLLVENSELRAERDQLRQEIASLKLEPILHSRPCDIGDDEILYRSTVKVDAWPG